MLQLYTFQSLHYYIKVSVLLQEVVFLSEIRRLKKSTFSVTAVFKYDPSLKLIDVRK